MAPTVKECLVCDNMDNCKSCRQCHVVYYCSKECQQNDWPSHKLLCKEFANFTDDKRPSPKRHRAIYFGVNDNKPQFCWVTLENENDTPVSVETIPSLFPFTPDQTISGEPVKTPPPYKVVECNLNVRTSRPLRSRKLIIAAYATKPAILKNNAALQAAASPKDKKAIEYPGPITVVAARRGGDATGDYVMDDMTASDYRCFIDYMVHAPRANGELVSQRYNPLLAFFSHAH